LTKEGLNREDGRARATRVPKASEIDARVEVIETGASDGSSRAQGGFVAPGGEAWTRGRAARERRALRRRNSSR